jgi:hypothetical protein
MFALCLACMIQALRLLDVRDWRCYGAAVMSPPMVNSLALGAVTPFLLLGAAAVWKYRDRPTIAGPAAAMTAVTKLFLWPLGLWLVVTRRLRAAAACILVGAAVLVAGWAVIGFADLRAYPHLLHVLTRVEQGVSYSPIALAGWSGTAATAASFALVGLLLLAVAVTARGPDGDRRSFTVAIVGCLVATPLLWLHYLALLLVPIAIYRPRLSGLWFVPLALWLTPASHANGSAWKISVALGVLAVVAARTLAERQTQMLAIWPRRMRLFAGRGTRSLLGTD